MQRLPATLTNLQRKQPFNNIHRLQADRNHFPNQLDDVLRVVCQVRVVDNATPSVGFHAILVYHPLQGGTGAEPIVKRLWRNASQR